MVELGRVSVTKMSMDLTSTRATLVRLVVIRKMEVVVVV